MACKTYFAKMFSHICRMNYRILFVNFLILLYTVLPTGPKLSAQTKSFQEYQVKAVFLYNLTNFVLWPDEAFDSPNTPFKIGILGADPFGISLDKTVQNEEVNGRQIVVQRFTEIRELDSNSPHILFISSSLQNQISWIIQLTQDKNVLTVGDVEDFAHLGGIVNLVRKENRIHLEINVDSARSAGLKISSKLLKLATIVRGRQSKEEK